MSLAFSGQGLRKREIVVLRCTAMEMPSTITIGLALLVGLGTACSSKRAPHTSPPSQVQVGDGCGDSSECAEGQTCLHGACIAQPTGAVADNPPIYALEAQLAPSAAPDRTAVRLTNTGEAVLTLRLAHVVPDDAAYEVASMGTGPFWIRPGRTRELYIERRDQGAMIAELVIESEAPTVRLALNP